MKKLVMFFSLISVIVLGSQAWATLISFQPIVSSISVGESVDVDVVIAGLGEFDDVGAFDFNVLFNEDILAFDSYSLTGYLGENISADFFDLTADAYDGSWGNLGGGEVNLSELSWLWDLSFQPDSFALATLSFTGINAGTSLLLFDNVVISDAWGYGIATVAGIGAVDVAPVPEPATMLLFGSGLVGLIGSRLRKKK